jgi:hypothetical protein
VGITYYVGHDFGWWNMDLSKERALQMIGVYLTRDLNVADFIDGWPEGAFIGSDESVWSIEIPPDQLRVGGSRFIVVSRLTGKILADEMIGE